MANHLTRFDPFSEISRFEPFRGIEEFLHDFPLRSVMRGMEDIPRMRLDVSETEKTYEIKADIPGMKKEDIKVSIEGNHVTISAEMKQEKEEKKGETVVRAERYFGHQSRSFTLGHEIDDAKAVAHYQDGVLSLSLPKKSGNGGARLLAIH